MPCCTEQDLYLTNNAQMSQQEPSQRLDARISEERTPLRRDLERGSYLLSQTKIETIARLTTAYLAQSLRTPL